MGVDFSAKLMVGVRVTHSDFLQPTGQRECYTHGDQSGKHCQECGRSTDPKFVPTATAKKAAEYAGKSPAEEFVHGLYDVYREGEFGLSDEDT